MAKPDRGQRVLTTLAVALLAIGGAVGLGRVFIGVDPRLRLILFAVLPVVLAELMLRRRLWISALASLAALLLALGWAFYPQTLWLGLPTPHTLDILWGLATLAGAEMRTQVAPTWPLGGLMVVALSAAWLVSWSAHSLAARARYPLGACVGPLVMFAFADIVLEEGSRPAYGVLLLLGIVAVLFADGLARVRRWGPLEIWQGPSRRVRSVTVRATRGAWGVAVVVVLAATLAPAVLPGWGRDAVLHPRSGGGGTQDVDPLVSIRSDLTRSQPQRLLSVDASRPAYWRMLTLEHFDGVTWSRSDLTASDGRPIQGSGDLLPSAGGSAVINDQRFEVIGLRTSWLPMGAEPATYSSQDIPIRFDSDGVIAVATEPLQPGDSYEVTSRIPEPTPAQLDAAPEVRDLATREGLPPGLYERFTQIARSTSPVVAELATSWTQDVRGQYREILAIQQRLRERFVYDETIAPAEGADPLEWFLTDARRGFCQQFAGAMAAMARTLGYPARIAVGFLPGAEQPDGTREVTTDDAHAWPEIYFAGVGWVAFEPTPGRSNPAGGYLDPAYLSTGARPGGGGGGPGTTGPRIAGLRWKARHATDEGFGDVPLPEEPRRWFPYLLAVAVLALLALAMVPPVKFVARRVRLRRARDPRELVLVSFDVFSHRIEDLGLGRQPGQTLREFAEQVGDRAPSLRPLVEATTRAAYASEDVTREQARGAADHGRSAAREMGRAAGVKARLFGAFRVPRFRSGERSR